MALAVHGTAWLLRVLPTSFHQTRQKSGNAHMRLSDDSSANWKALHAPRTVPTYPGPWLCDTSTLSHDIYSLQQLLKYNPERGLDCKQTTAETRKHNQAACRNCKGMQLHAVEEQVLRKAGINQPATSANHSNSGGPKAHLNMSILQATFSGPPSASGFWTRLQYLRVNVWSFVTPEASPGPTILGPKSTARDMQETQEPSRNTPSQV